MSSVQYDSRAVAYIVSQELVKVCRTFVSRKKRHTAERFLY